LVKKKSRAFGGMIANTKKNSDGEKGGTRGVANDEPWEVKTKTMM